MPEWSELRADFEALRETLRVYRLDCQWGTAGVHHQLAGGLPSHATRRFEVLAEIAGNKLYELPASTLNNAVLKTGDAMSRWYEALRYHSGAFEFGFVARQTDAAGNEAGHIYAGSLSLPAEASALISLRFSALPFASAEQAHKETTVANILARLNHFLREEATHRGYLWLLIAFIITVIIGLLAL